MIVYKSSNQNSDFLEYLYVRTFTEGLRDNDIDNEIVHELWKELIPNGW